MNLIKKSFAAALSFALIAVSPGLAPYEALAQVRPVPVTVPGLTGGLSAAPVDEGFQPASDLSLSPLEQGLDLRGLDTLGVSGVESQGLAAKSSKSRSAAKMPEAQDAPVGEGSSRPAPRTGTPAFLEGEGFRQSPGGPDDRSSSGPDGSYGESDGRGNSDLFGRIRKTAITGEAAPVSPFFDGGASRLGNPNLNPAAPASGSFALSALEAKEQKPEEPKKSEFPIVSKPETGDAPQGKPKFVYSVPGWNVNISNRKLAAIVGIGALLFGGMQVMQGASLVAVLSVTAGAFLTWGLTTLPSFAAHEYGHAKMAHKLGDQTAFRAGRMTLNPFKHIDPIGTVALPLLLLLAGRAPFGWAKPVPISAGLSAKNHAWVAFAGPGINLLIALVGAGLYRLVAPQLGVYGFIPSVIGAMVDLNLTLAVFNMMPFAPFDGGAIFRRIPVIGPLLDKIPGNIGIFLGFMLWMMPPFSGIFGHFIGSLHYALIAAPLPVIGSPFAAGAAGAGVFAMGAAMIGALAGHKGTDAGPPAGDTPAPQPGPKGDAPKSDEPKGEAAPAGPGAATPSTGAVDLIVELPEGRQVRHDLIPNVFNLKDKNSIRDFRTLREGVLRDLESAGADESLLRRFEADPQSAFRLIRTVTLRVDGDKEAGLRSELTARGFKVHENRRIPLPKPVQPENHPDRKTVTLDELQKIVNSTPVQKAVAERLGPPELLTLEGFSGRMARWIIAKTGAENPAIKVAVVDSGVDGDASANLKRALKKSINVTDGVDGDDIGHGTHVADTAISIDPWQRELIAVKAFKDGWATTEDILKALTAAGNEDALIIGNSWGDSSGDPASPEAKLVIELAKQGRILVFAAGNEGPGKNTIGGPAIVVYNSPETGAPRVISVAAADYRRLIAGFSSRGEVSPKLAGTEEGKTWPLRPDMTAMGVDLEAATPGGRKRALSGTSMATPNVWGAISLLARKHGVTKVGAALDAIAKKTVDSSADTGRPGYEQGKGFLDVGAADKALAAAGFAVKQLPLGSRVVRKVAIRSAKILTNPKFARYLAYGAIAFAAVKGALVGLALPSLATAELIFGGAAVAAALGVRLFGGKRLASAEKFLWAAAVGGLVAGGVGLGAAYLKAGHVVFSAVSGTAAGALMIGSIGGAQRLPNGADRYEDALKQASDAAALSGTDASKLEFTGASASMQTQTMQWNYTFRAPSSTEGQFDMYTVQVAYPPQGGYTFKTVVHQGLEASLAGGYGAKIGGDVAPLLSKQTPDSALAAAQRDDATFGADTLELRPAAGEQGLRLEYVFHSADGRKAVIDADSGAVLQLDRPAPKPEAASAAPSKVRSWLEAAALLPVAGALTAVTIVGGMFAGMIALSLSANLGIIGLAALAFGYGYAARALRRKALAGMNALAHATLTAGLTSAATMGLVAILHAFYLPIFAWLIAAAAGIGLASYLTPSARTKVEAQHTSATGRALASLVVAFGYAIAAGWTVFLLLNLLAAVL